MLTQTEARKDQSLSRPLDMMSINERIEHSLHGNSYALERVRDEFVLTVNHWNQCTGKDELLYLFKFDANYKITDAVGNFKRDTKEKSLFRTLITAFQGNYDLTILQRIPRNSHITAVRDEREISLKKTCGKKKSDRPMIEICLGCEHDGQEMKDGIMAVITEELFLLGATAHQEVDGKMKVVSKWTNSDKQGLELMISIYSALDSMKDMTRDQVEVLPETNAAVRKVQQRIQQQASQPIKIALKKMPLNDRNLR